MQGCKHAAGQDSWAGHYTLVAGTVPTSQPALVLGAEPTSLGNGAAGVDELSTGREGFGSKCCAHWFSVLSRKIIVMFEHLLDLKP